MKGNERFSILIIDPDSGSRATLKQVALSLPKFKDVGYCASLSEAMEKSSGFENFDVVTISSRFSEDDVKEFLVKIKKTPKGRNWAFISVLKPSPQQSEKMAKSLLIGIDGFLFEPYSADNLKEIVEVTAQVKTRKEAERRKAALEMFLKDISFHLDAVAFYCSQGRDALLAKKKLVEACNNLKSFKDNEFDVFIDTATEHFSKVQPPLTSQYNGVSERVRQRLKNKMLNQLGSKYE